MLVFPTSLSVYLHLFWSKYFHIKGRVFQECLQKRFLEFLLYYYILFSHTYLSYPLLYQSYRRVVVRVLLGDPSVEITKVFHLVFKEANLRVRVVSNSCGSSV